MHHSAPQVKVAPILNYKFCYFYFSLPGLKNLAFRHRLQTIRTFLHRKTSHFIAVFVIDVKVDMCCTVCQNKPISTIPSFS